MWYGEGMRREFNRAVRREQLAKRKRARLREAAPSVAFARSLGGVVPQVFVLDKGGKYRFRVEYPEHQGETL